MPANKIALPFTAIVLLACFSTEAQPATNASTNPVISHLPFDVGSKQELVPGLPPATRVYITNRTGICALLTPDGYRLDNNAQDCILLVNETYDCFMTFRIVEKKLDDDSRTDSTYYRSLLSNRFPNVKSLEEFSQEAGGLPGLAFDFQWQDWGKTARSARVVFIPSSMGILEFNLACSPDKFKRARYDFNGLLLTFRIGKDGKLEIPPRTNLL